MLLRRPRCTVSKQGPTVSTTTSKLASTNTATSPGHTLQTWQTVESATVGCGEEEPLGFLRSKPRKAGSAAGKGLTAVVQRAEQYIVDEIHRLHLDPSEEAARKPGQPQRIQVYRTALALLANDIAPLGSLLTRIMQEYDCFIVANCPQPEGECSSPQLAASRASSRPASSVPSSRPRTPLLRGLLDGLDEEVRRPLPPESSLVEEMLPTLSTLPSTRLLEVEVVEASSVVHNAEAAISAYISLRVGDVLYKTGLRHATLQNPIWREKFLFLLPHDPRHPSELCVALHDRQCDIPLASSALQVTAAMLDQWARMDAPRSPFEGEWDTRDVWLPLRDAALGAGPEVHLRFRDHSRQEKLPARLPVASTSAQRPLNPKALFTLCKGCLVADRLPRDPGIQLDSLKQVGLKDRFHDLQRTVLELKGYVRLFLCDLEARQQQVERLEVELQKAKSGKRDFVCASVHVQTDPGG